MESLAAAGLIYAALALDHIAVGQFMLSRPLVVGPVLGAFLGDAPMGFLAGAVCELLWVHVIPVGIWPIDSTVVAGLATTWTLHSSRPGRSTLALALLLAVPFGVFARHVDIWFRRQNVRFLPWIASGLESGREGVLTGAVALSLVLWYAKAWGLFVLCAGAGHFLLEGVLAAVPARCSVALDFTARCMPVLGFCVVLNYFIDRARGRST